MTRPNEKRELVILDNILRGFFLAMGFFSVVAHGKVSVVPRSRNVSALYVLGDSSVDCGNNTLFYSHLHRNLSLIPCNGSDGNLLPHLLGMFLSLFPCFFFLKFFLDGFVV